MNVVKGTIKNFHLEKAIANLSTVWCHKWVNFYLFYYIIHWEQPPLLSLVSLTFQTSIYSKFYIISRKISLHIILYDCIRTPNSKYLFLSYKLRIVSGTGTLKVDVKVSSVIFLQLLAKVLKIMITIYA